jgi:AcrR family transcriptional regulator
VVSRSGASAQRAVGRPRTPILSRDGIIAATLELIDEVGVETFSLGLLARRMSVTPSSFYNHAKGKEDILIGAQDLITDAIDSSMFARLPWGEAATIWARNYRAAFVVHPNAVALFATTPVMGGSTHAADVRARCHWLREGELATRSDHSSHGGDRVVCAGFGSRRCSAIDPVGGWTGCRARAALRGRRGCT